MDFMSMHTHTYVPTCPHAHIKMNMYRHMCAHTHIH